MKRGVVFAMLAFSLQVFAQQPRETPTLKILLEQLRTTHDERGGLFQRMLSLRASHPSRPSGPMTAATTPSVS